MKRRTFLRLAATTPLLMASSRVLAALENPGSGWRTFVLTYEVDLTAQKGPAGFGCRCLTMRAIISACCPPVGKAGQAAPRSFGIKPTGRPCLLPSGVRTTPVATSP